MTAIGPAEQLPEQELRELFRQHAPTIKRYINRRIDDFGARDDIFQHVWFNFLAYVRRKPVDNVGGFLLKVAMVRVKDWYARAAKCEWASDIIGTSGVGDPLTRRENELLIEQLPGGVEDVELRLDLAKALCEITPVARLAVGLTYVDRFTNREVGVALDLSQQRVHQILSRALAQLRQSPYLTGYGRSGEREVEE